VLTQNILLHFDAKPLSHAFEHDIHGLDDFYLRVCLAVHNHLMLGALALGAAAGAF
jgi:hypothetical protein